MAQMKPNSLAVFNSNDIYPISADSTMPFEQHRDILYLSGVDQEESVLVLFPDSPKEKHREILFLKETNDNGVMTRPIWQLIFKSSLYADFQKDNQKNALILEQRIVNIPSSAR